MRQLLILTILFLQLPAVGYSWGKRGHDVICHIAERHLTAPTMSRVTELLGGRSMVYYGNWMDSASRSDEYRYTYTWHYMNMDLRDDVSSAKRNESGDLLTAAEHLEGLLRSGDISQERESVALKMMIHIIGDMHQPLHLGRKENRGGGDVAVVYFVESTSLHAVWDYHIVEGCHSWSYTEWGEQIDRVSTEDLRGIVADSYEEWIDATHEITREIYRSTPRGHTIYYDYMDHFTPIVEQQLLHAGVRLAHLLNSIYDPGYDPNYEPKNKSSDN